MSTAAFPKKTYVSQGRKKLVSKNTYLSGLVNLYEKIVKSSTNVVVQKIAARLKMSRNNRPPLKVSRLAKLYNKAPGKVCVVVGKVLDDIRVFDIPKMQLVVFQITRTAREKIEKAGGSVHTLDQLFDVSPTLENVSLFRGKVTARKAYKYFGLPPGEKGSRTYPRSCRKGKRRERRILK